MATPHINAEMGDFADVVLMPGDPLRAKYIAETFLEDVVQVCDVRNMYGFTGTYKGRKVSVMGHGMGIPSCSIYATELIKDYGVKKIIRVGSCGAVSTDIKVRDVVIGMGACTDSKVNRIRFKGHDFAAIADYKMVKAAEEAAKARGIDVKVGNLFLCRAVLHARSRNVRRDGQIRHCRRRNGSRGHLRGCCGIRRKSTDNLYGFRPHQDRRANHIRRASEYF